jgi:hypothetical protein
VGVTGRVTESETGPVTGEVVGSDIGSVEGSAGSSLGSICEFEELRILFLISIFSVHPERKNKILKTKFLSIQKLFMG